MNIYNSSDSIVTTGGNRDVDLNTNNLHFNGHSTETVEFNNLNTFKVDSTKIEVTQPPPTAATPTTDYFLFRNPATAELEQISFAALNAILQNIYTQDGVVQSARTVDGDDKPLFFKLSNPGSNYTVGNNSFPFPANTIGLHVDPFNFQGSGTGGAAIGAQYGDQLGGTNDSAAVLVGKVPGTKCVWNVSINEVTGDLSIAQIDDSACTLMSQDGTNQSQCQVKHNEIDLDSNNVMLVKPPVHNAAATILLVRNPGTGRIEYIDVADLPTSTPPVTFYTGNGSLTSNRIVSLNNHDLFITGNGNINMFPTTGSLSFRANSPGSVLELISTSTGANASIDIGGSTGNGIITIGGSASQLLNFVSIPAAEAHKTLKMSDLGFPTTIATTGYQEGFSQQLLTDYPVVAAPLASPITFPGTTTFANGTYGYNSGMMNVVSGHFTVAAGQSGRYQVDVQILFLDTGASEEPLNPNDVTLVLHDYTTGNDVAQRQYRVQYPIQTTIALNCSVYLPVGDYGFYLLQNPRGNQQIIRSGTRFSVYLIKADN